MTEPERKQITLISDVVPAVEELAEKEERSFPNMVTVLLREAIAAREASIEGEHR